MIKKWKRQLVMICSAFVLAVSPVLVGAVENTTPETNYGWGGPDEEMGTANLIVSDSVTPSGEKEKDMQVRLTLKNIGDGSATNVTIRPVIKTGEDSPFEPKNVGISTIRYISAGGTGTANFTLTVKKKAVTGYYSVDYSVIYYDENSTSHTLTVTSYVFIEGLDETETSTETDIEISLRNSPTPASSSFNCPLKFDLYLNNFGKSDAYSVSITPTLSASTKEYPFEIEKATYEVALKSPLLGTKSQPDEAARNQVVHYSLNVRNDVTTGYYPVVFKIAAKDENGKEYKTEQTVFFNINGNPKYEETTTEATKKQEETSTKVSVPRLIITGYETNLETVNAGDSFKLTIHVQNTSSITSVSNIKFTLNATDDAFLPISGSSTLFISRIGAGQTVDLNIEMNAKASLEAKSYPLTLEAEYEDNNLNPYTAKESISIPVSQEIRMSIGEIEVMPSSLEIGNQANIMFPINNMGKSKIYNVSVLFEGDTVSGGESFKGNIDSGATANVDVMITAMAATADDPTVYAVVTYEDDRGKKYDMKKSFELYVSEPFIPEETSGDDMPDMDVVPLEEKKSLPNWAIPAGGVVLAAFVAAVVIRRKRKRKKEEGMEDDEIF